VDLGLSACLSDEKTSSATATLEVALVFVHLGQGLHGDLPGRHAAPDRVYERIGKKMSVGV